MKSVTELLEQLEAEVLEEGPAASIKRALRKFANRFRSRMGKRPKPLELKIGPLTWNAPYGWSGNVPGIPLGFHVYPKKDGTAPVDSNAVKRIIKYVRRMDARWQKLLLSKMPSAKDALPIRLDSVHVMPYGTISVDYSASKNVRGRLPVFSISLTPDLRVKDTFHARM